ncbi:MAG TPA: TlpA disulfide reductase family protein [Chitinophagaceae bacterium]|jgi:thiol-disulfide isomerase/thioredoxin
MDRSNWIFLEKVSMMRFFLFVLCSTFFSFNRPPADKFSVKVTIKNGPQNGKAFLRYFTEKGRYLDSVTFTGGEFVFNGSLSKQVISAKIYILEDGEKRQKNENTCDLLLEPGNLQIIAQQDLLHSQYTGSILQEQFSKLQQQLVAVKQKQFVVDEKFEKAEQEGNTNEKDKLITGDYSELFLEKQKILGAFIRKYPSSMVSAYEFEEFAGDSEIDLGTVEPVYEQLSDEIKKLPMIQKVAERMAITKKTAVGMKALSFTQQDTSGNMVSLSSFTGKYLLLDFWAGWCVPCRAENPGLVKLYSAYHDKGFEILSVSLDGERNSWIKAIENDKMAWIQVSDLQVFDNAVAKLYGISSIPQNILIGTDGKIIAKNLTTSALDKKLAEFFK